MITTSTFCKSEYGQKLYKLSLQGGFSCPNRDGTCGSGGCIFCSDGGSGDFAEDASLSIDEQIESAKKRVAKKYSGDKFIAYFQSFTNTYAPLHRLKSLYDPLLDREDIAVISIATRPDCLPSDVIDYLGEINRKKPLWVELGLQTTKEESVEYIRRGYENSVYDKAAAALIERGIHVITHVILGLPGESREDMLRTVEHVLSFGNRASSDGKTDCGKYPKPRIGIKLQLLHVLKGTELEKDFRDGKFETLSEDEYFSILHDCADLVGDRAVIHRLTGDGPKKLLVSPLWSGNKRAVLNRINREFLR